MAITTLDQVIAGAKPPVFFNKVATPTLVAGRHQSLWGLNGFPGAGSFDATPAGVALSSSSALVNGQLTHYDPVSGNSHLARFQAAATQSCSLILADRLWHNGGFSVIIISPTAQNVTSVPFPSRDNNQTNNGHGILLGLEVSAATGAGTPTVSVSYTNQDGTAGRTGTAVYAGTGTSAAGTFIPIGLQAGDTGVRSVQSLTLSATWTSGTINLVAYRPLATLELIAGLTPNAIDSVTGGFPQLFDGVVPFLIMLPSTTTASIVAGQMVYSQG